MQLLVVSVQELHSRHGENSEACSQEAPTAQGESGQTALGLKRATLPARVLCGLPGELLQSSHVPGQGEMIVTSLVLPARLGKIRY